jgi:hypothetical protein
MRWTWHRGTEMNILDENPKRKDQKLDADGRIMLKLMLKEYGGRMGGGSA